MQTVFIDYIPFYYSSIAKATVPSAVSGKFVQIEHTATRYLVFSPLALTKYHANVVEQFCRDKGLEGAYDRENTRYDIHDEAWSVRGGGKFELNADQKTIKFYGDSMAYGKFDARDLKAALTSLPEFSGFTVLID
jgi:hypothetical protein